MDRKLKKRRMVALDMNTDKKSLKPLGSCEVERVKFNDPIELFAEDSERIAKRKKKRKGYYSAFLGFCKFISLFLAFSALFYVVFADKTQPHSGSSEMDAIDNDVTAVTSVATSPNDEEKNGKFVFSDESGKGIDVNAVNTDEYTLSSVIGSDSDVRVIIMHAHSSERVAEGLGVAALGEELCERLNKAGVVTFHCTDKLDKNGVIGAYNNMKVTLATLRESYPDAVLLIDLHNSDFGGGFTFSVGADESFGWTENLTLALALCRQLDLGDACTLRILPSPIGQDSGLLSLHLGIGGDEQSKESVARLLDAFVESFAEVCQK